MITTNGRCGLRVMPDLPGRAPLPLRSNQCGTLPLWQEFDAMVHQFFYSRTLADLLSKGEIP